MVVISLTEDQLFELEEIHTELQRVNSNKLGEFAVMLARVLPNEGLMTVKIFDNFAAKIMAEGMDAWEGVS